MRRVGLLTTPIGADQHALRRRRPRRARRRRATGDEHAGACRSSARRGTACSTTSTGARPPRARRRGARRRADGPCRGRQRRRRHGDDLPRLQGRHRHGLARAGGYTVGVLVQANHGARRGCRRRRAGRPRSARTACPCRRVPAGGCRLDHRRRRDRRAAASAPVRARSRCGRRSASARTGGARRVLERRPRLAFLATGPTQRVEPSSRSEALNPLFYAAIEATEEAIVNALLAAETMTGRGFTAQPSTRCRTTSS